MTVVVNDESKHSTFSRINIVICFIPCGGPTVICFIPCGSRAADPLDGHHPLKCTRRKDATVNVNRHLELELEACLLQDSSVECVVSVMSMAEATSANEKCDVRLCVTLTSLPSRANSVGI
ncbi:hypothetical protein J6590_018711 [Homalodisca vitripennis]|nr:hypothetical protein J6590_018711 [Homalodisca vitripennis]